VTEAFIIQANVAEKCCISAKNRGIDIKLNRNYKIMWMKKLPVCQNGLFHQNILNQNIIF